jgi:uncharacterized membrane protein
VSTKALAQSRLAFIDALRGIAVVLMVQLHSSHGWVHPSVRSGAVWHTAQFLGGLAAPMFLTLAGVSLGLRWARDHARGSAPRLGEEIGRGLQLIVLGYLLRLQMWFIDAGGHASPSTLPAQALLLAAYVSAYFTLARWTARARHNRNEDATSDMGGVRDRLRAAWGSLDPGTRAGSMRIAAALAFSLGAFALGLWQVAMHAPARWTGALRVDVLQCIGGSLVLVTAAAAALRRGFARPAAYVLLAIGAACLASWTRAWVPGPLPEPLAAYLGQWPAPPGRSVVGLFPLFPWVAYAFAGAALGLVLGRLSSREREVRVALIAAGACWVALTLKESNPLLYGLLQEAPWLTQPLRVTNRLAWVLVFMGLCLALCRDYAQHAWLRDLATPLVTLGRASLLVYWVHLEFAFGVASSPIAKELGLRMWLLGTLILSVAMWFVAWVRVEHVPAAARRHTARTAVR